MPPSTETEITRGGFSPIALKAAVVSLLRKPPPSSIRAMVTPAPVTPVGKSYSLPIWLGSTLAGWAALGRTMRVCATGRPSMPSTDSTSPCRSFGTASVPERAR